MTRLPWHNWSVQRRDIFYLLVLGLLVIGAGLGLRDPWPADEPRFALIARDMVETGHWLFPHVGGVLYPDKPPVFFWIMAGFYSLTGSVRAAFLLPSLLAGLGTLVLVYDLGRRLWSRQAGWLSALLLLVTLQFVMQTKMARIDALLTFLVSLGFYGFTRHLLLGPAWRWYCIGFVAVGLGIITKGVGFLPLLLFIPWAYARLQGWEWLTPGNAKTAMWLLGPLLMLGVVATWLVPMLVAVATSGDPALVAYRDEILFRQTASRFVEGWHHGNPPWYFFTDVIPKAWFPINLVILGLLPAWAAQLRTRDSRVLLPIAWAILVLLFFSMSEGKRGVYILPILPALALVAGPYLAELLNRRLVQQFIRLQLLVASAALFYLVAAEYIDLPGDLTAQIDPGIDLLAIKFSFVAVFVVALIASFYQSPARALFAGIIGAWLLVGWWGAPMINESRIPRELMASAGLQAGNNSLGIVHWKAQHLLYANRDLTHFGFRREDFKQEMRDGLVWLLEEPDRVLMVPDDVRMRCIETTALKSLGSSNRHEWFLVFPEMLHESCRQNYRRLSTDIVYYAYRQPEKGTE